MSIISWTPQNVVRPLIGAFKPSAAAVLAYAKARAPGPETRAKTKLRFIGPNTAQLDARDVGPSICPIISGSRAGTRVTGGYFVIPGGPVVKAIAHPGTPEHQYIREAGAKFPPTYVTVARSRFGGPL